MWDLFQSFKYGDRHEGLPLFGRRMAAAGAELLADVDAIVLVPSTARGSGRGALTCSALVAQAVSRLTGVPDFRRTPSQVGLSAVSGGRTSPAFFGLPPHEANFVASGSSC